MKIDALVKILKKTLVDGFVEFDNEEDKMDFILDVCNKFKEELQKLQDMKKIANIIWQVYKMICVGIISGFLILWILGMATFTWTGTFKL